MRDYEVGYCKPPKHSQFKKGNCANPSGRGARKKFVASDIVENFLNGKKEYRQAGRRKRASRLELTIRKLIASATNGDVDAAQMLLRVYEHARKYRDIGPLVINIMNALPD